jgi:flagellar basal-body rod protein FlgC
MSIDAVLKIAGSGLNAQLVRMNTIASNLANATVVAGSPEDAYKAKRVVFASLMLDPDQQGGFDGYVFGSNVNEIEEMVEMLDASRAYQNNVSVVSTAKDLLYRTLDLIKV